MKDTIKRQFKRPTKMGIQSLFKDLAPRIEIKGLYLATYQMGIWGPSTSSEPRLRDFGENLSVLDSKN